MKLLVTNDDGVDAVFLHELVAALKTAGHAPYVVAPRREQSWTSASKTRTRGVKATPADHGFGCPTWTVEGTPSDCVNIAIAHLLPTSMDGVVSGINMGFNCTLGFIIASGTVGGAWEGALHGLPALAVSQNVSKDVYHHLKEAGGAPAAELHATLRASAAHAARLAGELLPATPRRSFIVHNVNFPTPCTSQTPVKRTVPAQYFVPGLFSPADADGCHQLIWSIGEDASPADPLTDLTCVESGWISHTVLDYRRFGHG